jgi:hypothetical protein
MAWAIAEGMPDLKPFILIFEVLNPMIPFEFPWSQNFSGCDLSLF